MEGKGEGRGPIAPWTIKHLAPSCPACLLQCGHHKPEIFIYLFTKLEMPEAGLPSCFPTQAPSRWTCLPA